MQHFLCTLRNILNKTKKRFLLTNWSLPFVTSQTVDFSISLWSIQGESRMNGRTVLSSWETCVLCLGITGEGSFVPCGTLNFSSLAD